MNKTVMAIMLVALFALPFATAAVVNPENLEVGNSERRDLSTLPTQTVEAQAGNVTAVNIDTLSVTKSWQGYYGNISGEITLDDGNSNTFYNWSVTTPQGEVYATRNSSAEFTSAACASGSQRTGEETFLGHTATDGDSVTNTFNFTSHPAFNVSTASVSQDTCFSTNAFSGGSQDTGRFHQVLLADGAGSMIYTTLIDAEQVGFDGSNYDFQLLVGENGDGNTDTTTYYFFVELE